MRYLITSALPYINGIKHLGNLAGSMLPADVYARFRRSTQHDVLFICATDEHGTPAELAAAEAGMSPAEYCKHQHDLQAGIYARFNLSFDHFGRSSSNQNHALTQHFAQRLEANGFIEERVTLQAYSPSDGRFLPDRYVIGTCPHCGYVSARGDQCESCTRLLDPEELIDPRSAVSGKDDIEFRESRHLFLLQSKLVGELRSWLETKPQWPTLPRSIAFKWLDDGLEDRGITRDLDWGVPVDREGFEEKVFYVWFDAPIAYIGATQEWAEACDLDDASWKAWWEASEHVHYVQFMAKDNIPFHTVGFPATILGSREPWKLVDYLKGFNWLTYYGGKFSTSQGRGVFMNDALDLLPSDCWRYYLMANAPEADDSHFTWEGLALAVNKDLADTLGNFVNRSMAFTRTKFGEVVPTGGIPSEREHQLERDLRHAISKYEDALEAIEMRKSMQMLRSIWALGNSYLEDKSPWTAIKADRDSAAVSMRTALNLVGLFARLSEPVIPDAADKLCNALGLPAADRGWPQGSLLEALQPGSVFTFPGVLFRKLDDNLVSEWRERFGAGAEA